MIYLSVPEIIQLHAIVLQKTGGSTGTRDFGALESALPFIDTEDGAFSMFAGEYLARVSRRARACRYFATDGYLWHHIASLS